MISENIKTLRAAKGLTQKELADMLHVTAQAVSRWENGDAEPSIGTITEMAKIFGVTTDELIKGPSAKPMPEKTVEKVIEKEYVVKEQKPVLAVCEQCNKPIYDGKDIVRIPHYHRRGSTTTEILCRSCDEANKKKRHDNAVAHGLQQRNRSFVWGGVITGLILAISLIASISAGASAGIVITCAAISLLFFPFISCLFLKNNFVGEMVESVAMWGFVKFPGVIFTLDLGGIIWLIGVKILFWILGFMIAAAAILLGVALGLIVSPFVYPFALSKSFKNPELTEF